MYRRSEFSHGGHGSSSGGAAGYATGPPSGHRRRFRGQYFRTTMSPSRQQDKQDDYSGPSSFQSQQQQNYNNNNNNQSQRRQHQDSHQQTDIEDIKELCSKLSGDLEIVKQRITEIASNLEHLRKGQQASITSIGGTSLALDPTETGNKRRRIKVLQKQRVADKNDLSGPVTTTDATTSTNNLLNKDRDNKRRNIRKRQEGKDRQNATHRPLMIRPGDDSTTQAADPSSEDKNDGEEGQGDDGGKQVQRRRKQHLNKRRFYNNRRRRNDSSERNSNDTSPQNEINGDDYRSATKKSSAPTNRRGRHLNGRKRSFPELSESEISEIIQVMKRDFFSPELDSVKKKIDAKGPVVAQEFASSILDHAMCDVTSPTKLSEIANNLFQLIISEQGGLEFQQGFYGALSTIATREDDLVIDAPRYMDTLGQILGECVVPMNTNRHRQLLRRFLNKSLNSYGQKSRALLLASTMRGIARHKEDRFAKDIWDVANLKWSHFLSGDVDVNNFIESEDVKFTTQTFSPLPRKPKKTPEELEKFADDVTNLVEKRCTPQTLEELVRDLELESDERVDFLGTLVYAIVRGCLTTESGDYKLDTDALSKYSNILNGRSQLLLSPPTPIFDGDNKKQLPNKKEILDAIALHALTALTKLWHQYNCPQNLMSTILLALHNHGAASYDALKTWLNSDDLKNIPGIGAARLNSKRCIEDLCASRG